jgi:hypothetical protein
MMRGNRWCPSALVLALATDSRPVQNGEELLAVARAMVLLALEAGPRPAALLPRAWPVSAVLIRAAVRELELQGLIEGDDRGPRACLGLTPLGWNRLAVMKGGVRWSA